MKKRIAIIIDTWEPFIGGGQVNAKNITKILAKKYQIDVVTRNLKGKANSKYEGFNVIKLGKGENSYSSFSKIIFCIRAYFFIYKSNYDLIHAHAFLPGIVARLIMVTKGTPAIFTVHGTSINTNLNNRLLTHFEKFILTSILYSAQITVSRDFLKVENINKRVIYVPNGVDTRSFDKIKAKKMNKFTFIFVGRLHKQKNLLKLIKALKEISKKRQDINLLLIGDGPMKREVNEAIKAYSLEKTIIRKKEVTGEELIRLYKSSHVFILPSIYEGQPLTVLEAWASKLTVLATNSGDIPFLLKESRAGFLIKSNTAKEIESTMERVLKSRNLDQIGARGYNFVKQNLTWEKSASQTGNLYDELLKAKN